jgi:outer membrane protein assembly factor BamE (lipoprotein component of BamABCDE complex)
MGCFAVRRLAGAASSGLVQAWVLALVLAWVLALSACVTTLGGDFSSQRLKALEPGAADKARVLATLGDTDDRSQLTLRTDGGGQPLSQPLTLDKLSYFYLDRNGQPTGLEPEPRRLAWLVFRGDQLIGYSVSSTFASDSTDFATDGLRELRRGRSTQDDVRALFGPPSGKAIHPIALDADGTRWTYRVQWTADHQLHAKTLQVDFDRAGVVIDFDYSATQG